jgi:hypothetical protein
MTERIATRGQVFKTMVSEREFAVTILLEKRMDMKA